MRGLCLPTRSLCLEFAPYIITDPTMSDSGRQTLPTPGLYMFMRWDYADCHCENTPTNWLLDDVPCESRRSLAVEPHRLPTSRGAR